MWALQIQCEWLGLGLDFGQRRQPWLEIHIRNGDKDGLPSALDIVIFVGENLNRAGGENSERAIEVV